MAIECKHCGQEIPDEVAMQSTIPDGMGVVMYKYSPPDELGTVTDYYCSPKHLAAEVDE